MLIKLLAGALWQNGSHFKWPPRQNGLLVCDCTAEWKTVIELADSRSRRLADWVASSASPAWRYRWVKPD